MAKNKQPKSKDARKSTTEQNRTRKRQQAEARQARLIARTQKLIGQHVEVRMKDQAKPLVGTVLEVIDKNHEDYPHQARRHVGLYLRIRTVVGELLASRHRVKPLQQEEQENR